MESNIQENVTREQYPVPQGISGLGGWLVLVQILLYLTLIPLVIKIPAYFDFFFFNTEIWDAMTTEGAIIYHELWGPLLIFQMAYNTLLLLFSGYIVIQFYQKKAMLPRLMIISYIAPVVFGIIDLILVYQIPLVEGDPYKVVVRDTLTCAIFIPYFMKSERVRNTFVR